MAEHAQCSRRVTVLLLAGTLAGSLASCSGGGGDDPGGAPPSSGSSSGPAARAPNTGVRSVPGEELEPPELPRTRDRWQKHEYQATDALSLIDAASGYALRPVGEGLGRAGGGGITVAVLDDGINFDHPDLLKSEHDRDFNLFTTVELPREYGTEVAGIIAARRNEMGMHGVAYNANLVSLGTCEPRVCPGDTMGPVEVEAIAANIASAAGLTRSYGRYDSNPDASSHILNMSFVIHADGSLNSISNAMRDAADAGRIMVAALGDSSGSGPEGVPAANVADPGIAGHAIAVGALNGDGTGHRPDTRFCGSVRQYCLFAPGQSINTTAGGGGLKTVGGTSIATGVVSGAAAVMRAAFPHKSSAQIVERLLTTADSLDGMEISPMYGHGKLDLGSAMNPLGFLSLPMRGGGLAPLSESFIELPPGFVGPVGQLTLADAIVYDEQMFPFRHDLRTAFRRAGASSSERALREFMDSLGAFHSVLFPVRSATLEFVHLDDPGDLHRDFANSPRDEEEPDQFRFSLNPVPQMRVSIGQGFDATGASNEIVVSHTRRTPLGGEWSVGPFAALAGRGPGMSMDLRWGEDTTFDFTGKLGEGYFGSSRARLASLGLTRRMSDALTAGARVGTLRESGSQMGIRASEAFTNVPAARTEFLDLSVGGRVSESVAVFGSVSQGTSTGGRPAQASLVTGWSDMNAGSFVVGTEVRDFWRNSDRLTLTASSPLRARRAALHLAVPDRELADGVVEYTREEIDLTPSGRERRLQLVYESRLSLGGANPAALAIGGYVRVDPDHDADADADIGAAARIRMDF